jgi:hypothetical protein
VSLVTTLGTSSAGGVLPAGHGDPRYFDFHVAVTMTVTYG